MQVTVQLPDEIAQQLGESADISREFLKAFAAESYRTHKLSRHQVSQLLGLDYWQTDEFLTQHEAARPYTMAELEIDRRSLATLPEK